MEQHEMNLDHHPETEKTTDSSARGRIRDDSPPNTRHSPTRPLAPLEYLQNQRRGSITDPSLHAASQNQTLNPSNGSPSTQARQSDLPPTESNHANSTPPGSLLRIPSLSNRSNSPLIFGDASGHPSEHSAPQPRRSGRLHSDHGNVGVSSHSSQRLHDVTGPLGPVPEQNASAGRRDEMDTGPDAFSAGYNEENSMPSTSTDHSFDHRRNAESGRMNRPDEGSFGQTRNNSINAGMHAGAKRKASADRDLIPGEEIDPQLVGPGIHTLAPIDTEAPAAKRRSSAFDTQRISQLSLYDRRNSVDSRTSGAPSWWGSDRRDSSSSMFSNTGYNSPAFSGDSRPSGSMPPFAWPPSAAPGDSSAPPMQPAVDPSLMRPFEGQMPQTLVSPGPPFDRRMSVPDMIPSHSLIRPERVFRSRSRPPSRANTGTSRANGPSIASESASGPIDRQEEPTSATSSNGSHGQAGQSDGKGSNSTPYSRSPELRVSHKLAERKRRKEMKDLFDELRDQLPADRGMKASKWEILSKAIDFIQNIKQNQSDMMREIEMLRHELDAVRHGGLAFGHPPPGTYPPPPVAQYPPPPSALPSHTHGQQSRPGSSHNAYNPMPHSPSANGKS